MKTAKALGFKKGNFVSIGGMFVGIIIGDVHTSTPCQETWGFEHETGSAYADELRKISPQEFLNNRYFKQNAIAYSQIAKDAIKEAMNPTKPVPTANRKEPNLKTMESWILDGVAEATDGCRVEPDGTCPHGCKSWLLVKGLI